MTSRFAVCLLMLLLGAPLVIAQQPLPITQVLLYKNGMAYIVRSGQLTAPLSLTFHPEDMNDVLKSFTAWNPDSNALYSVGYTAGIPSSHTLRRFPFDVAGADTGLGGFLSQVKGAELRLALGGSSLEGTLMAVQPMDRVVTQQTTTSDYRLTLQLRNGSLATVWLSDVRSLEFVDAQLRDQLRSYLDVLAEVRQDVTREVSVYPMPTPGPIRVAYLQQFPLWKTSYRVDLGDKESRVQGWAQIDNPTGESWNNVEVSLLSGAPVSFVMNLYEPLYTRRATVGVPGAQVAGPRQYEAAVGTPGEAMTVTGAAPVVDAFSAARGAVGSGRGGGVAGGRIGPVAESLRMSNEPSAAPPAAFQQADAIEIQDAFEYRFPFPVQLASRQSALLPFLQKTMNIERLSIFNARADRGNPRLGARIENTSGIPLEAGPATFFESGRYAGEAVLDHLSRGEKHLVSYGVDHDVQIASRQQGRPATTTRLTINRGIAVLFRESVLTHTYEIRNKGTQQKTLIVEHARQADRKLTNADPWETTEGFYRFRVSLAPGASTELPVGEIVASQTQVTLQALTREQLVMFAGNETPQEIRAKLGQIVDYQEQIAGMQAENRTTQERIETWFRDQERLRENLKALGEKREEQELRKRYLDQLTKQEDQLQQSRQHIDEVNKDIAAAQGKLAELIANLTWK